MTPLDGPSSRRALSQLIGLRLAFDTVGRGMDHVFTDSATIGGVTRASEIASVAAGFGGPRLAWSVVVAAFCGVCVVVGVASAWRRPRVLTRENGGRTS